MVVLLVGHISDIGGPAASRISVSEGVISVSEGGRADAVCILRSAF